MLDVKLKIVKILACILRMVYDPRTSTSSHLAYLLDATCSLLSLSSSKNNKVVGESLAHGFENTVAARGVAFLLPSAIRTMDIVRLASCQNQAPFPRTHF